MGFEIGGRTIDCIGVVGSGQIGPDIALHFAKTLSRHGVSVVVVDIDQGALDRGQAKLHKKVDKPVKAGRAKPEQAEALKAAVQFTSDYDALAKAQLVIEAASEDAGIKRKIFNQLEQVCSKETILTSNSSHLEPEAIFAEVTDASRCLVTHYFFPAERNPVVELVPSDRTDAGVVDLLEGLYELTGKLPVRVKSRYGYAIDPVFEGLFLAACIAVEREMATIKQVDAVCQKVLGQGVGPFTAMNLTGGNPLTRIGLSHYGEKIAPWFRVPKLLIDQLEKGEPWPTAGRDETVDVPEDVLTNVGDWMRGAYFALTSEIADAGLINVSDFDEALGLALAMKPAFSMMNKLGTDAALALVKKFAESNEGMPVAAALEQRGGQAWPLHAVQRRDYDDVAVLTIRRFKVLNALSRHVLDQLEQHAEAVAADDAIKGVVVRGFGTRAFVAGADIRELASLQTPADAIAIATRGQQVFSKFEDMKKPVIAAMNGLAFGGGNELAMSCHARIAAAKQKVFVGQPEPKLGVIPGYGGTQRLPRLIGFEKAWPLLRKGDPISSAEALELGLIREEVAAAELLKSAIELARAAAKGDVELPPIARGPIEVPAEHADVDIGHLSTVIDKYVVEATVGGAQTTLAEGLELEAKTFGHCLETEDFKIGMENFAKNGPKKDAEFVNR